MHPRLIGGIWWSTTKPDGFLGGSVLVETAKQPSGPWEQYGCLAVLPHGSDATIRAGSVTYSPILWTALDRVTGSLW